MESNELDLNSPSLCCDVESTEFVRRNSPLELLLKEALDNVLVKWEVSDSTLG